MAASSVSSSTLLCGSTLSRRPHRGPNHALGRVLLPLRSSADCSPPRLSSSSHNPYGWIRSSSSQRYDLVAPFAVSGSRDVETSAISEDVTDLLDEVKVLDLNGSAVPISDLWKDRKAVVAFARHFGCVLCRKRSDYLAAKKDRMDASGVALVLIGPGSIDQAKAFVEQTKFEGEVYADPNHSSYEALKFVSGVSTTFTPGAGLKIIQSYMEGYRQDWQLSFEKDTVSRGGWQQGGIIVAGPGKRNISYIHRVSLLYGSSILVQPFWYCLHLPEVPMSSEQKQKKHPKKAGKLARLPPKRGLVKTRMMFGLFKFLFGDCMNFKL